MIQINGHEIKAEIDSGATTSVMSSQTLRNLELTPNKPSKVKLSPFNGKEIPSIGKLETNLNIEEVTIPITFEIFDQNKDKCLIGIDWLKENNVKIDIEKEEISLKHNKQKCKTPIVIYQEMSDNSETTDYETDSNDTWSDGESNDDE